MPAKGQPRTRWIEIRNWDRFQQYRDRDPIFIKNYVALLHDDDYLGLTGHQRAVLHGLWLAYASSGCQLRVDTASLSRQLGLRVSSQTLERLNHAGFIRFRASKPLALARARARSREAEAEETAKGRTVVRPPAHARTRAQGLPIEIEHELDRLVPQLRDVDAGSRRILELEAGDLPQATLARVRESVERRSGRVGVGYVVNALRSEREERGAR
jgi:hypothetical protein